RPDLSVGDGVYKSTDAGKTWTHLDGLRDGQQIAEIKIDPKNSDKLFVAVAGHPYAANEERGIYRSTNGGKTFEKALGKDENTGGWDIEIDPTNSEIIYASLWESREGAWENARFDGVNGGIFKSTDGGKTWNQLTKGLPAGITQASLAVAPSNSKRLFAGVRTPDDTKFYRSEDGGDNWTIVESDARPANRIASGDLGDLQFDPKNADVIYAASIVTWKSIDGGKTWTAFRGAPGGDDYQNIWINPNDSNIILLGSDQGAIITVNGGASWSSWYNQPTAQLYHVSADNAFPYRLCSGQQESGSVCISSRGDYGEITFRDWTPVAAEEYGYVVADPLNPDIIYGGKLSRFDRRTGQAQNILPKPFRGADFRMIRTQPVVFSPVDNRTLYFSGNTLWKTLDGGQNWQQISPDLTRKTWEVPASIGKFKTQPSAQPTQRGVIYTVAPSFQNINEIWVGTDDGLIHLTTDGGKQWSDVTPPQISAWQKISIIEAGHFDSDTAYAAVNTLRLDDNRPHIYRTHDGGKTWKEIIKGIPEGQTVNVVREDTERKGLLFAGTERAVYVSFDDGENWQSLRFNMPATSVRDLIIKDNDIAVGTHGRGFWILDNITPLRQLTAEINSSTALLKPQTALRVRWNLNTDTPLPPDEPAGENPPDGAVIDYYLDKNVTGEVTLEIRDKNNQIVRRYSSSDKSDFVKDTNNVPAYWIRPTQVLSREAGMHRFLWDMHYAPVPNSEPAYPISAVYRNTALVPTSPWAMPGEYSVALTVGGKSYTQPLTVKIDPRVKTSAADLTKQFELSKQLYDYRLVLEPINERIGLLSTELAKLKTRSADQKGVTEQIFTLDQQLQSLAGETNRGSKELLSLSVLPRLQTLFEIMQEVDTAPTPQVQAAVADVNREAKSIIEKWQIEIPALNRRLEALGLPKIEIK
ncbi:MAG: glycoside hydrolase, partial [Pyrinomonadaceae bacterium]